MKIYENENYQIRVKNPSAYWIPPIVTQEVIHGTTYIVAGSFDGTTPITHKLERIMARRLAEEAEINIGGEAEAEDSKTEDRRCEESRNTFPNGGPSDDRTEEI